MGERSSTDEPVAVSDGYRGVERRRNPGTSQTPTMDMLAALPALLVLERLPVPVLAVEHDGTIVFANEPFARMVGWPRHGLVSQSFSQIFHGLPTAESVVSVFRDHAGVVVELAHADGWIVRARMSTSALQRVDDPVALVAFDDLTEQLWSTDATPVDHVESFDASSGCRPKLLTPTPRARRHGSRCVSASPRRGHAGS